MSVIKRQKETRKSFLEDTGFHLDRKAQQDLGSWEWGWEAEAAHHHRWKEELKSKRDGHVGERASRPVFLQHRKPTSDLSSALPSLEDARRTLLHPFLGTRTQEGARLAPVLLPDDCSPDFDGNMGALRPVLFHSAILSPAPQHPSCLLATLSYSMKTLAVARSLFTHPLISCHNPG